MSKIDFKGNFTLLNKHIQRHFRLMVIASSIISVVALAFVIYWQFDEYNINPFIDNLYLGLSIFFFVISTLLTTILIISKYVKFKTNALAVIIHVYTFLLFACGTTVCVLDLRYGFSPLFYLTVLTVVSGLFIVEPLFYAVLLLTSASTILAFAFHDKAAFFSGDYAVENTILFCIYLVVVALSAGEHFGITINNYKIEKKLEHLTYYDELTGLLNERSYLQEIEEVDKKVEEGKLKEYAVILMDLNNIKATNDTYGHRYGCHLIVTCGHNLPNYFKSSKLFHVGGDEFVAIVYGKDYENLDEILKTFETELEYSTIKYSRHELIFSLAHGVSKYKEGQHYKDVLQKADKAMYKNKEAIKEKYHLASR